MTNLHAPARQSYLFWIMSLSFLAMTTAVTGCGGSKMAAVSGTVSHKGKPITGGTLIFSPAVSGQPASAEVEPDGTFKLGTIKPGDGALIGKHRVTFTPPPQQLTEKQQSDPKYNAPPPLYMGLVPKQVEVEIKSGPNVLEIELVRPS